MPRVPSFRVAILRLVLLSLGLGGVSLGACVAGRESWVSCRDPSHFVAPPRLVRRGQTSLLTYRQGSYPFAFFPSYAVADGRLVFRLGASSSSGSLAGRWREHRVEGAEELRALERGGAFWAEPDGTLVRLQVEQGP